MSTTDRQESDKQPMLVNCRPCGHTWVAAYLPMDMMLFASLLKTSRCPHCGGSGKTLFVASKEQTAAFERGPDSVKTEGSER